MLVSSGRRVLSVTRARLLSTVAVASMEDGSLRAHVSRRGREAPALLPRYLSDARGVETFDAVSRPDGVLQLSVAENQMISDWLVPRIRSIAASPASDAHGGGAGLFEQADIFYQQTHGTPQCRAAVAAHMERVLCGGSYPIDPDKLVVGAGCNAVLENLLFALADAGEGVLAECWDWAESKESPLPFLSYGDSGPPQRENSGSWAGAVGVEEALLPAREAEQRVSGLLLTPGASMRSEEPGLFRCVFSAATEEGFEVALQRFARLAAAPRAT
ncbi:hypothetical protein EMIHUDRAFT_467730 [Emiliania huxleyi CCMP1516]|uniref:Aminotransferase class I/classII large domain-containing protein n=2 Tax=Emiliania huxleyi TaxID=2903 RepID=A0A0D3KD11_EMIH1|nr:hypothetical protein EMIHUDRAFT_467730 [Emiliania huxleyi CCMP1516]EOD33646.1 hypothetical protein EMIHUDRAFT_467730 [Emiliania huxleyi CCMP1516]|eukprot:XP_005786075.1 hypothetical protein EMIHUDRAFT_467730 [Emiliania huxleyi CCMP1516]